ncbi:hypothetical protein SapgrDRAFT_0442 [Saprospira grandis DSM 2844]|uniref:Uncharacterized protein n=1 Tax=Saprospira grandis DSM 2844 TaxID=694433 RepID=J0P450_9BACT|nr:hypothetical protein SapgrDRAFT_0442 [Saprospira grandis DSM 2844]
MAYASLFKSKKEPFLSFFFSASLSRFFYSFFLGLPLALLGSGYVAARRSARPCSRLRRLGSGPLGHCFLSLSLRP